MQRRSVWIACASVLAAIAAVAVVAPALGGSSLKKMVKKEVARQIAKARGPAGQNGVNGVNGLVGTARAYARVTGCSSPTNCTVTNSKGVASVTHPGIGDYCVEVPGIDAHDVAAVTSVDAGASALPEGNASAMTNTFCLGTNSFEVETERIPTTGTPAAALSDSVAFTIVIP